ncbi:hypothetical protein [Litchfieldia alkalitelluris]|uniref:hypothetical protein n=1 Tax=Litchfieldia alkalitelluris TaxID=304268 RepID=UPI000995FA1F|nr:hypothetical protein [Litchfieldia alkalitelluris]
MDKELKNLKDTYDDQFSTTTFSSLDKENVYLKIKKRKKEKRFNLQRFLPKTLSYLAYGAMIILIFGMVNNQVKIVPDGFTSKEEETLGNSSLSNKESVNNFKKSIGDEVNEDGIGELIEKIDNVETTIALSPELEVIYEEYADSENDALLKELSPLDIFKFHFHAKQLGDERTLYNLYFQGEYSGTPSEEEYFGDPEFFGAKMTENDQKLYNKLLQVKEFNINYLQINEAIITWEKTDESFPVFRMIKDTKQGVWKVSWLPMQ